MNLAPYIVLLIGLFTASPDPIPLIRGAGLEGWQGDTGLWEQVAAVSLHKEQPSRLTATPGRGVLMNGPVGNTTKLLSAMLHADVQLSVEFMIPQASNSGIYLMSRYEVQISDSAGDKDLTYSSCGGIYERFNEAEQRGWDGVAPKTDAAKPAGEWQRLDIVFRAPRFNEEGTKTEDARFITVLLNGEMIHENAVVAGPTRGAKYGHEEPLGPLMLQGDHGPVAFRNIEVVHLNLD